MKPIPEEWFVAFLWLLVGMLLGLMAAVLLAEAICREAAVPSRISPIAVRSRVRT